MDKLWYGAIKRHCNKRIVLPLQLSFSHASTQAVSAPWVRVALIRASMRLIPGLVLRPPLTWLLLPLQVACSLPPWLIGLPHPQTSSQLHKPFLASQVLQASRLFLPPKLLEAPGTAPSPPTGPFFCTTCPFSWALLSGPPMVPARGEIQQPFFPQAPPAWSRALVCSVSAPPDCPSLLPQPDSS